MSQIAKLYAQLLANPRQTISFRHFERLLRAFGFEHARTNGSHRCFEHKACARLIVAQPKGSEAKPYQVRQMLDMIEEFGLTLED
jgi:predicted RNA binding protein YcfA (HicA-like mRNA interferase family)